MKRTVRLLLLLGPILGLTLAASSSRAAALRLAHVFTDHMVLQREMPVPIWGWDRPAQAVTVRFAGQAKRATADDGGRWQVELDPLDAGGPFDLVAEGSSSAERQDVLVGEVWLCSGQSNMAWPVSKALNADSEIAAAEYPHIRLLHVIGSRMEEPAPDIWGTSKWQLCSSEAVAGFSAAGYFFARSLYQELAVPIGLINSSVGGTSIEFWISREKLASSPATSRILHDWEAARPRVPELLKKYESAVAAWEAEAATAKAAGKAVPKRPRSPRFLQPGRRPAVLFNGLIHPLIPLALRGVIWYQGESGGEPYGALLPALVADWRQRWGRPHLPFCIGQLHNVGAVQTGPNEACRFDHRREAQLRTSQALKNVGLTVHIDLGVVDTTHYPNKQEVGRRFSLWAQGAVYGRDVVYAGPIYQRHEAEGTRVRVWFAHADGGLVAKDDELKGFVVAGADRVFHWAKATVDGDTVVVWSDAVAAPAAVRYGWAMNPRCTLYNAAGLPASPFRTDAW